MKQKPVQFVYYAFDGGPLTEPLIERHVSHAKAALQSLFDLSDDAVKVVAKKRASPGQEFQLTCYVGRSETDAAAMVLAAKAVLPHLRETLGVAERTAKEAGGWSLGEDEERDERVLEGLADGRLVGLPAAPRAALANTVAERLGLNDEDANYVLGHMSEGQLANAMCWLRKQRPRTGMVLMPA
ncbi:hypothetical protein D3C71_328700 [compost metagenome]